MPIASPAASGPASGGRLGLQLLLLILPAVLIYANTLYSPFVLDDHANITDNRAIRLVELSFENLVRAGLDSPIKTRPVAYISFALNHYLHGYDLPGYHLVNLLVHILCAIFLLLFLKTTFHLWEDAPNAGAEQSPEAAAEWLPFFTALIWLVHPLQTQSVTYVVQRMNSLAALFYIAALWLYARARLARTKSSRTLLFSGTFLAGALALGSKEIALTLPLALFLYEWFFMQKLEIKWLRARVPYLVGFVLLMALAVFAYTGPSPLAFIQESYKWRDFTMSQRLLTECRVVMYYLNLLIYPHPSRLNLEHDFVLSQSLLNPATTLFSLLAITGAIAGAVFTAKKNRLLSFCILCFFINLVIESSFLGLEIIFEHRTYLPSMFASCLFTVAVHRYLSARVVRVVFFCTLVVVFSRWTYERNNVWRNEVVFFTDSLTKSPQKWRVHANLGNALSSESRFDEALFHFNEALKLNFYYDPAINPTETDQRPRFELEPAARRLYADMLSNMGNALVRMGNLSEASVYLKQALGQDPEHVQAHVNMGLALSGQGDSKAAIGYYQKALQLDPDFAEAHNNLGLELASQGDGAAAIRSFDRAILLNPGFSEAYNNRGVQMAKQGNWAAALSNFSRAVTLHPDYAEAHYNLGMALFSRGKLKAAGASFQKTLALRPDFVPAKAAYAALTARKKQYESDLARLQGALARHPDDPELYLKLGDLYKKNGRMLEAIPQYERANEIQPDHIPAIKKLALAHAIKGDYDRALVLYNRSVTLQPQNADTCYKIAAIYARKQDAGNAVIWLEKAIERGYGDWNSILADRNLAFIRHSSAFTKLKNKYNAGQ